MVLGPKVKISDPDLAFALAVLPLDPALGRMNSGKRLCRFPTDAVDIDVGYGREGRGRGSVFWRARRGKREAWLRSLPWPQYRSLTWGSACCWIADDRSLHSGPSHPTFATSQPEAV